MLYCMDENVQGAFKKRIRVRKLPTVNVSTSSLSFEEDYYIPIAANDSQWNGIKFETPRNENTEHINSTMEEETVLKVIELEAEEKLPLLLLFPELHKEELNFQNLINQQMSTTDITKILVGKKPNLTLLKPSKRLNGNGSHLKELLPVVELSESEDSMENNFEDQSNHLEKRKDSRDTDESDYFDNYDYDY